MANVSHFQIGEQVIDIKDPVSRQVTDMTSGRIPANWSLSQGNYILIGDSYLAGEGGVTNWGEYLRQILNVPTSRWTQFASGGAGFTTGGNTFLMQLNASSPASGDNNSVTHVIVAGGFNDDNNSNAIYDALEAFNVACHAKYPNADIYVAYIANHITVPYENLGNAIGEYNRAGIFGWHVINGCWQALNRVSYVQSDGFHPTNAGNYEIACALGVGLKGGVYHSSTPPAMITLNNPQANISNPWTHAMNNWQNGDLFTVNCFGMGFNCTLNDTFNGETVYDICRMSGNYFYGCNGNQTAIAVPILASSNNFWITGMGSVIFAAGKVQMRISLLKDDNTGYFEGDLTEVIVPAFSANFSFIKN